MNSTYKKTPGREASVPKVTAKLRKVNKENRKYFGQKIKRRREDLQMTQLDLAKLTEQTYFTFISNIENGGTKIPSKDIQLWANALKVDLQAFTKSYLSAVDKTLFECLFKPTDRDLDF